VNHVLHETLALLQHQFNTANITIDLALQPELPDILGNMGKLQQVFLNLFLNAKDAMAEVAYCAWKPSTMDKSR